MIVSACLVIGRTIGRWSISCRLPAPQRNCGARRQRGHGRPPLQLRHGLGREHGRLLVPHVEQSHAGGVQRVVEREQMPAGKGEHLGDAVRAQRRQHQVTTVTVDCFSHKRAGYGSGQAPAVNR
jgi:hypothetical protein